MNIQEKKKAQKISNLYEKITYKCKCGHSVVIPETNKKGYRICQWCGCKVDKRESKTIKELQQIDMLKRFWKKKEMEK